MAWINSYKPPNPPEIQDKYGPDPYDINFCYPLIPKALENDKIKLTPFIPRRHAQLIFDAISAHPSLLYYMPFEVTTLDDLLTLVEVRFRRDTGNVFFVIIDKTGHDSAASQVDDGALAGFVALMPTSQQNLSTEIACIGIFPAFRRTHVSTHVIGLLLHYCLELPSASPPGLGLRRVQWITNSINISSIRAAERVGMQYEATLRWHRVLPAGKEGNGKGYRSGDPVSNAGRDTVVLSLCWDDWEGGGKEKVNQLMARTST